MLKVDQCLLEFSLQLLDLLLLVSVLNSFVRDGLLRVRDFISDRLFILLPFFFELFQFLIYDSDFLLKNAQVLTLELLNLIQYLLLFF